MLASVWPLIFILAAIAVLGVTGNLFSASPFVVAAQVAAIGLNVWARRSFQKGAFRVTAAPAGGSIIRRGPYRFIRHPMYSAALLFVWSRWRSALPSPAWLSLDSLPRSGCFASSIPITPTTPAPRSPWCRTSSSVLRWKFCCITGPVSGAEALDIAGFHVGAEAPTPEKRRGELLRVGIFL
jgi:hypothetical protein